MPLIPLPAGWFRRLASVAVLAGWPAFAPAQDKPADPAQPQNAARVLLDQAKYWRDQNPGLAAESIDRLLAADPDNAEALVFKAQMAIDDRDPATAETLLLHVLAAHPDDWRAPMMLDALRTTPADPALLAEARRLSAEGHKVDAINAYQAAFKAPAPPLAYAVEYYQTVSAAEGLSETAVEELGKLVAAYPANLQFQLAYAQVLTYHEGSREDGIDRLISLAKQPEIAEAARVSWHDALVWSGIDYKAQDQLEAYLALYPSDPELDARQEELTMSLPDKGTRRRMEGYQAMENKDFAAAEADFQAALTLNPQDADAMLMMAMIRRGQGQLAETRSLLEQAIAISPDRRDEFLEPFGGALPDPAPPPAAAAPSADGSDVRKAFLDVEQLTKRGKFAQAEAALRKLMGDQPAPDLLVQLGAIQAAGGRAEAAEASYRRAVAADPHSKPALLGLANVLRSRGKLLDAEALFSRAGDTAAVQSVRQQRAAQMADQAKAALPADRRRLYEAALALDPANPWIRLELARLLQAQGAQAKAWAMMTPVAATASPPAAEVEAALVWAQEHDDNQRIVLLIDLLPQGARTPALTALQDRAQLAVAIGLLMKAPATAQAALLKLAAQPDPAGERVQAIASALIQLGDSGAVKDAVAAALAATAPPTAEQRLHYAAALSRAGLVADAHAMTLTVDASALPARARADYKALADGLTIQQADRLSKAGQTAKARKLVAARLADDPDSAGLNLAASRVSSAEGKPDQALQIAQSVLARNPADQDARMAAVSAAIQGGELDLARTLADAAVAAAPDDPRSYLMLGAIARANGNNPAALANFRKAKALRQQQLDQ